MTPTEPAPTRIDPDRVISTLRLAFSQDPVIRWLLPVTDRYHDAFGELIRVAAGHAFDAGTVDVAYDGAGAALWAPPGTAPDSPAYADVFTRHIDATRQADVFAWGELVGNHHPSAPHWHLGALGVDPHWQGQGFGSVLLRQGLERCDRDGLPAYLESGNPRNLSMYARHGFEVVGKIQVADAPPTWPMLRQPRP